MWFLWRLKAKGRVRALRRRMNTLSGAITVIVGLGLFVLWVGSIVARHNVLERTADVPSESLVRLGLLGYIGFVSFSAISLRGVYLPRAELERLFAAPVSRPVIVRYRMWTSLLQAVPFALIVSVFLGPRFPSTTVTTVCLIVTIPTVAIFGQWLSLMSARSGGWMDRIFGRVPGSVLRVAGTVGVVAIVTFLAFGPGLSSPHERARSRYDRPIEEVLREHGLGPAVEEVDPPPTVRERIDRAAEHPVTAALTSPLIPWSRALTAPNLPSAAPWLAAILFVFVASFEWVARMAVDFRESSLSTSGDMERRMAQVRRGHGGVGAFGTSTVTRKIRIPWLAGTSAFGAVVWLRIATLVRQARGTLFVVGAIATLGVLLGTRVFDEPGLGPATVALLGVVYLGSGIRVDFRADLDRMESLKAWPLSSRALFLASVLPAVTLTAGVIMLVLVARALILQQFDQWLAWTLFLTPPTAFVWLAIDNAVFLLFPVRFAPGQSGALQHMGRGFLLVALRGVLLVGVLTLALGGAGGAYYLVGESGGTEAVAEGAAAAWVVFVGALTLAAVAAFGAWTLRRFDVSQLPAGGD